MQPRLGRATRLRHAGFPALPAMCSLALAAYLALHAAVGGPALARAWAAGGHATPQQWTYHTVLERLGFSHHHALAGGGMAPNPRVAALLAVEQAPIVLAASAGATPLTLDTAHVASSPSLFLESSDSSAKVERRHAVRPPNVPAPPLKAPPRTLAVPVA